MTSRFIRMPVLACTIAAVLCASLASAADEIVSVRFHPDAKIDIKTAKSSMNKSWPGRKYPDFIFKGGEYGYGYTKPMLWGNRHEYWADDVNGQFFALLAPPQEGIEGHTVSIYLKSGDKVLAQVTQPAEDHRISFLVRMSNLPVGSYNVEAALVAQDGKRASAAEFAFTRTDKTNPVVRIPEEGIPVVLEAQSFLGDAAWPVRTGIPLPINAVMDASRLALFEDGRRIPAEIRPRATWCPEGSVQWIHLDFLGRYRDGEACEYRLKLLPAADDGKARPSALKVSTSPEMIAVDNGYVQFTVSRREFSGIEDWQVDLTGRSRYLAKDRAPQVPIAPYLVDEKDQRFEPDASSEVVIEEQGPVKVIIAATGWYTNPQSAEKRLCKYATRITVYAGEPMIRFSHQTYITYDTRTKQLADLGFHLPHYWGAKFFQLGADGRTIEGTLPKSPATAYLHQDRWDHFRIAGTATPAEGKTSDGWFSLLSAAPGQPGTRMTIFLHDIWQKYPKEVEMDSTGLTLHFWPKHGTTTFSREEELDIRNLYKFLCFHHGALLNLQTPMCYVEKFDELANARVDGGGWWRESEQDATKSANGQGIVISNDFALVFSDETAKDGPLAGLPAQVAKLVEFDPTALAAPEWNAASGAFGSMAPADRENFPDMEDAIEKGYLSWARSIERNNDYGMFNYADTQTIWIVPENRPSLHRVWQSSHYHNVGTTWMLWYRSGSPDLLRWARKNTDHWMNVDMCNYVDADNPIKVRDHELGGMQHIGWKQHWASSASGEAWGQYRGTTGHFIDPDAALRCWYLTGNARAKEAYGFWTDGYQKRLSGLIFGFARETNTTLAYVISNYQATWNPALLAVIYGNGWSLRSVRPLETQRPGPLWYPLWINRYYDQTRDPEYVPLILKYADMWTNDESTWTLGLCGLAYTLTGDRKFIDKQFPHVSAFPRMYYRNEGHPYDWYAYGPGPLGENYAGMSWGYFLHVMGQAGVETLPDGVAPETQILGHTTAQYPVGDRSTDARPGTLVVALKTGNEPAQIRMDGSAFRGDIHNWHSRVTSPSGELLHEVALPGPGAKVGVRGHHEEKLDIPADAEKGVYRIDISKAQGMLLAPATDMPFEAQVVDKNRQYASRRLLAWFWPGEARDPVTLTFTAVSYFKTNGSACSVRIEDANGKRHVDRSLWAFAEDGKSTTITLDPKVAPPPWKVDVVGLNHFTWDGAADFLLLATNKESFEPVLAAVRKAAR